MSDPLEPELLLTEDAIRRNEIYVDIFDNTLEIVRMYMQAFMGASCGTPGEDLGSLITTDGTTFTTDPSALIDVPNFSFYYGTPEVWAEALDPANRPKYDLLYTSFTSTVPLELGSYLSGEFLASGWTKIGSGYGIDETTNLSVLRQAIEYISAPLLCSDGSVFVTDAGASSETLLNKLKIDIETLFDELDSMEVDLAGTGEDGTTGIGASEGEILGVDSIDLASCDIPGFGYTPIDCPTCIPNPSAFVPVWTEETTPFLNQKTCEYSITMQTLFPQPSDALLDPAVWETNREASAVEHIDPAIDLLIESFNKAPSFYIEVYGPNGLTGPSIVSGEEDIEAAESKSPVYSLSRFSNSVSPSTQTVYHFTGIPQEVLISINPDLAYTFSFPQVGHQERLLVSVDTKSLLAYWSRISEYEIAPAPVTSKMKVLIGVPATIFDMIPEAETPDLDSSVDESEPPQYVVFELVPRIDKGSRDNDFRVMIRRSSTALGFYAQQYAAYINTNPDDAFGYADLDLRKEGQYLQEFKKVLLDLFKRNGLNFRRVEKFRINFEPVTAGTRPYTVKSVQIYDCDDNRIKLKSGFKEFANSSPVNRIRTMAYISLLPAMTNDITAREAVSWQEFLERYTYPFNANFGSDDPQSTFGCAFESLIENPIENLVGGIANEILSFPDALGHRYNQRLCNDIEARCDIEEELRDIEELFKRMMMASYNDYFAGDSVMQFLPQILAGDATGIQELWSEAYDKLGWCAIIYLLQNALECLQQGLKMDEMLGTLLKSALEALDAAQLERVFIGLPPDKQKEVKEKIAEAYGDIPAPWDQGYRAGSYSGGGNTIEQDYFGSLSGREPGSEYVPQANGVGSIGNAADKGMDIFMQAYIGGIWDVFGEDGLEELYDIMQAVPGGELIAKILRLSECALPPLFTPPLSDFFKTLELDFCRRHYAITLPKFQQFPNFADMWGIFKLVLVEVLQALLIKILAMIFKTLFDILFGIVCALLEAVGTIANAALTGNNIQDALRDTFCGLGASEDAVNAAAAELVGSLSLDPTCPQPTNEDVARLFEDISVTLTQDQMIDLLSGEDSIQIARVIEQMIATQPDRLGTFSCIFPSANSIADFFKSMGYLVPQEYKTRSQLPEAPLNIGLCGDPEAIALQDEYQCNLLMEKGVPAEKCNELIEKLRCKNLSTFKDLNNVMQNGVEDLLPPIYAAACGEEGILPDPYSTAYMPANLAMSAASQGLFSALAKKHNRDLLIGDGFLNMVLSDRHGRGLRAHSRLVGFFNAVRPIIDADGTITDRNLYPPTIAEHLRQKLEDYGNGGVKWSSTEDTDYFYLTRSLTNWRLPKIWDEESREWVDGGIETRKKEDCKLTFFDYKLGKDVTKNDSPYGFNMYYTHFVFNNTTDKVPVFDGPLDYYRLRIEEHVWDAGDSKFGEILSERDIVVDAEGAENISADVYNYLTLPAGEDYPRDDSGNYLYDYTDGPHFSVGGLDVGPTIESSKKDPHSVAFAKLIRKSIEDNWNTDVVRPDLPITGVSPEAALDGFEIMLRNKIYPILMANMFNRSAHLLSKNSRSFTFGYNEDNDNPSLNYLASPKYVPEEFGGSEEKPKFYLDLPENSGWLGIYDALAPPDDACPPDDQGLGLWDGVSDVVDQCTQKFLEDERLSKDPSCFIQKPFEKLLSKGSSALIEGVIVSTLRIHILEVFLRGMPNFSILKPSFPDLYDDLLATGVMDSILNSLAEANPDRPKNKKKDYYYAFLEQIVQNYGKKIDSGMITLEPGSAEEEALNVLRQSQVDFMKTRAMYPDGELVELDGSPVTVGQHLRSMTSNPVDEAIKAAINGGSTSSALTNSVGKLKKREKYRMMYWRQHMDKDYVKENCKIILKKYINDELTLISDQLARLLDLDNRGISNFASILFGSKPTYTLNDTVSDPITGKLGNPGSLWSWGSLQASGHSAMTDGPWDPSIFTPVYGFAYGPQDQLYQATTVGIDVSDYFSTQKYYWPFLFEKYVTFTFAEDANPLIRAALQSDELYENTVINIYTLVDHINRNPGTYEGLNSNDIFADWKYGIRLSFVPPYDMLSVDVEQEVTIATGPTTIETSLRDHELIAQIWGRYDDDLAKTNKAYWATNRDPNSTSIAISSRDDFSKGAALNYAIPIVSAESDSFSKSNMLEWNGAAFSSYVDCLIADLTNKVEYKTLFNYSLSFARFNSIWATYNIYSFLPSIGSADDDYKKVNTIGGPKWKDLDEIDDPAADEPTGSPSNADEFGGVGSGNDGWIAKPTEAGGGKPITFSKSFRGWDRDTFKRSRKFARIMFNTSYYGDDSEYSNDRFGAKSDRSSLRPASNLDLGLGWIFKSRQRPKPPDACDD